MEVSYGDEMLFGTLPDMRQFSLSGATGSILRQTSDRMGGIFQKRRVSDEKNADKL
jgi:hypothetical protein